MNEIIAAGILLVAILFIWRLVQNITVNVTVKVPSVEVFVTIPPIKIEQPTIEVPVYITPEGELYDEHGKPTQDNPVVPNPMAMFNQVFQGIEEAMKDE